MRLFLHQTKSHCFQPREACPFQIAGSPQNLAPAQHTARLLPADAQPLCPALGP